MNAPALIYKTDLGTGDIRMLPSGPASAPWLSIIAKADAFKSSFGMLIGTRHRLKDAAIAAQSLTELADIEAQLL